MSMSEFVKSDAQSALWERVDRQIVHLLSPEGFLDLGMSTGRPLRDIAEVHKFPSYKGILDLIEGKCVLDLGAGYSDIAQDAEIAGVSTEVVHFDIPNAYVGVDDLTGREVAGNIMFLPFLDNTFDVLIATYSFPTYSRSVAGIDGLLDEGLRVLRPGGVLSMAPLIVWQGNNLETREVVNAHFLQRLVDLNDDPNYEVELRGSFTADVAVINKLTE